MVFKRKLPYPKFADLGLFVGSLCKCNWGPFFEPQPRTVIESLVVYIECKHVYMCVCVCIMAVVVMYS